MNEKMTRRELSYVMIKPIDANDCKKIVEIYEELMTELSEYRITVVDCGYTKYDTAHADVHYQEHMKKSWYLAKGGLQDYITSDKVFGAILEGREGLKGAIRKLVEEKLRDKYQRTELSGEDKIQQNVIHASACVKDSEKTDKEEYNELLERSKRKEALSECKNFLHARVLLNEDTMDLSPEEMTMKSTVKGLPEYLKEVTTR